MERLRYFQSLSKTRSELAALAFKRLVAFRSDTCAVSVGETDPPSCGLRIDLYQMAGNRCSHIPLPCRHVEVNARP